MIEISRVAYQSSIANHPTITIIMSRGRSERKPDRQLDHRRPADPFTEMHQIMRSFGGLGSFGSDFFGQNLMRDPFEQMMDFSTAHRGLHKSGKQGSYVCQTYVGSSTMGPDGKLKNYSYFENTAGQHKNGQTISQKQQGYKDNDGLRKIAEERMLNDQGRKIIRERKGDREETTNHYYNLQQHQADRFDQNWRGVNQDFKFLENHQKQLANGNIRQLELNNQPARMEQRNYRENQKKVEGREQEKLSQFGGSVGSRGNPESRGNYSQKGSSYKSGSRGQH